MRVSESYSETDNFTGTDVGRLDYLDNPLCYPIESSICFNIIKLVETFVLRGSPKPQIILISSPITVIKDSLKRK
jgi:hypothetical protein